MTVRPARRSRTAPPPGTKIGGSRQAMTMRRMPLAMIRSAHGVGLDVYQLQPGYLIKSYSNLADPTTINGHTWSCDSDSEAQPGQGAGALVLAWFKQRNG